MKKVLLATSAFALMAGAASAEIALSGSARMGLIYADNGVDSTTSFSSRVRIVFTASGETDTGLSFGASMRADQFGGNNAGLGSGGTTNGDSTVFISGSFGKLTMGDVGGAADALVGQVSGVGYGPYDDLQEIGFIGTHKTAIYYEYSTGALTFGAGSGQLIDGDKTYNIAVKYSANGYSAALGWETDTFTDEDLISASASGTFGAATVKAKVADSNIAGTDTAWALSVDYATGPTTITAFYTDFGNNVYGGTEDTQHIGIGASYDLGGGASVAGGIIQQQNDTVLDQTFADLGLKFSF